MDHTVTIIGAGNGGITAAYHLAHLGREVCLYDSPSFPKQIKAVNKAGGIRAMDEHNGNSLLLGGFQSVAKATTDIVQAVEFSDTMIMICPSFAQEVLFASMIPHLRDGQILITMPGNFASLVFQRMLDQSERRGLDITFVDAISIPWATRLSGPAQVDIMGLKQFLPVSIFPKSHGVDAVKRRIEDVIPIPVEYLQTPLEAGMENINFGGHPLMTTVNIGLLENFHGAFTYYQDCCSPATARATAKMDEERLSVGRAYGYSLRPELEAMNALYDSHYESVYDFNRASSTHGKVKDAPDSSRVRYITEDVPYLLVPIFQLGEKAGLRCKIMESVICLASAYNDEDYLKTGRTLEQMGLAHLSPEEIKEFLAG